MPLMRNAQPWLKARSMHRRKAPLFRVFSYRKKARPSIPPHKEKSPIKRSPPLPKVLCLSVIAREREKGSMLYQYVLGERHISSQKPILPVFSCTASLSFFLQARYPRQMIPCPLIASFVNFSSTLSSEPSFTTISSAALR